jgi:hypothetical protein
LNINDALDIFELISSSKNTLDDRNSSIKVRANYINKPIVKQAFDTRRIDQETFFNPRRNLQSYSRSEPFVSEGMNGKIKAFKKLLEAASNLKEQYDTSEEFQNSYLRILVNSLEKGLRSGIDDGDFSETQAGVGSLNYIEELLFVRYRLTVEKLEDLSIKEIEKILLDKDEDLKNPGLKPKVISKKDITEKSYDQLIHTLFGDVKATAENPEVERSVTITIRDSFKKND